VIEVAGRAEAVRVAVGLTSGGQDTVLVAGKGHEQGQEVAGVIHPFDDRAVLRDALLQREPTWADRVGDPR
jgi:UDP-N-acetylmuramoyl-L-alanyl-D-glutamate--2,6-diaminopimelate ligase